MFCIGADINVGNVLDESALLIAIAHGRVDIVRLFITPGTDITHGGVRHSNVQHKGMNKSTV